MKKITTCCLLLLSGMLFAQTPQLSPVIDGSDFPGSTICTTVELTNSGAPGYGPYLQLVVPEGLSFNSSSLFGAGVTAQVVGVFPAAPGNQLIDPISGVSITGDEGETFVILQPPIGSVVAGGIPLEFEICFDIDPDAPVNVALEVSVTPAYEFGDTATGDNGSIIGTPQNFDITPILIVFDKQQNTSEDEINPGPSWPITYTLTAHVANNHTINNVVIDDVLPPQLVVVLGDVVVTGGVNCVVNSLLNVTCDSVTGVGADDIVVTYTGYFSDVLAEASCSIDTATNNATFDGDYLAMAIAQETDTDVVELENMSIQKSVNLGVATPGNSLTYSLDIQISDYAEGSQLTVTDVLPDGVTFTAGSATSSFGAISPVVQTNTPSPGETTLIFDVTAVTANIPSGSALNISYQADINQIYQNNDAVLANDVLTNVVDISYDLAQGANACSDNSSASTVIEPVQIQKEVITTGPYAPNEVVTYRLTMNVPSGDSSGIIFDDFFPLPVFDVNNMNLAFGTDIRHSVNDTLGLTPVNMTVNPVTNSLHVTWPDMVTVSPQVLSIDVDITVVDEPFADNLSLSNLLQVSSVNSESTIATAVTPVLVQIRAPEMVLTKGVSASDQGSISPAPALLPVDGNVNGVDADDSITFVITAENIGGAPAFDVVLNDPATSELTACVIDSVTDGTSAPLPYTGNLTVGISLDNPLTANDNSPVGGGAPFGTDTALLTVSCTINGAIEIGTVFNNTATLSYASGVGATPFPELADAATITVDTVDVDKDRLRVIPDVDGAVGTATIGELIEYEVVVTVAEGVANNAVITDQLDNGLLFDSFVSLSSSSGDLTTDVAGGFAGVFAAATGIGTRNATFDFGTLTNTNTDNSADETITLVYQVLVADVAANSNGNNKNNNATFTSDETSVSDQAPNTRIREPRLTVNKSVNPSNADAGDTVLYTLVVTNAGTSPAYETVITDPLSDPFLSLVATTVTTTDGTIVSGNGVADTTIQVDVPVIAVGASVTITFSVDISLVAPSGTALNNTASAIFTSLPGVDPNEREYGPVTGSATVNVAPATVVKTVLQATSTEQSEGVAGQGDGTLVDLTIGEEVTFEITATLAEGVSPSVVITDTLPNNAGGHMEVVSATVISEGASLTPTNSFPAGVISPANVVTFDFGSVANFPDGVVNSDDQIVVRVTAVVLDDVVNSGIETLTNNVLIQYNTGLDVSGSANVEVVEPNLQVNKSGSTASADAGDTITYTIEISNPSASSSARGFDVDLSDTIPTGLTYAGGLMLVSGYAPDGGTLLETAGVISASWTEFPLDAVATISYQVTVDISVAPEQMLQNTAIIDWSSMPGANGNERSSNDSGSHTVTITSSGVSKTVVSTSEPSTGTSENGPEDDVTIGEEVTYQIILTFPEGTSPAATLVDQLPSVVAKLDVVSSQVLSIGGNLTVPGVSVGDAAVTSDSAPADGYFDVLTWTLNNVINAADGVSNTDDQIVFEVVAVVVDHPVNQSNLNDIVNNATFTTGGHSVSDSALIDIVEPILSIDKTTVPNSITADAGDILTYRLTVAHEASSSADAFNLTVTDVLPNPGTSWVNNATVVSTCPGLVIDASADPIIEFTFPLLTQVVASCTIEYDLEVDLLVNPNQVYANTATTTYTSTPGDETETRTSQDMDGTDFITSSPAIMKVSGATSLNDTGDNVGDMLLPDLAIGETIDFSLTVILPEGTTTNAVVEDQLPVTLTGGVLELVSATVDTIGTNISSTLPGTPVISNTDGDSYNDNVVFDFGTITNTPDGTVDVDDQINITVTARVVDEPINIDINLLTNVANFTYGAGTVLSDDADFEIVEPNLGLAKSMGQVNNYVVPITFTLNNTGGTAPAYDLLLEDVFDTAIWDVAGFTPTTIPSGFVFTTAAGPGAGDHTVSIISDPGSSSPTNSIEPNEVLVFVFNATLRSDVVLPNSIPNTVTLSESSSLPGDDPNERDYPPITGNDTLLMPALNSDKSDALLIDNGDAGVANPGDTLRYTITVTNSGLADATNVMVTDIPDPNGSLVVGSVTTSLGTVTTGNTGGDTTVSVNVGTIPAPATVTITYDVVIDDPLATGVTELVNQALISSQEIPDFDSNDPDTGSDDDPTVVEIVAAPDLVVLKSDGGASVSPGGVVVYTIGYDNIGNQDATGVVITETVPANSTFDGSNSTAGWVCLPDNSAGSTCTQNIGVVNVSDAAGTLNFAVTVDNPLDSGVTQINNSVSIADDGSNGADLDPSNNNDSDDTPIDAVPDLSITKDDGGVTAVPGQVVVYAINYANNGNQTATGVVITETVPAQTTFVAGSSTAGWVCTPDNTAGSTCQISVADLNGGGASGGVNFAVQINNPVPSGFDLVTNSVSIADDGSNGPDPTPGDNGDTDDTPVNAVPDMAVAKSDGVVLAAAGQLLSYTINFENVGNQQATGVVLTETVPVHTTFNAGSSSAGWVCAPNNQAGSICTLLIGTVNVGTPGSVVFAVDVDDPLAANATTVFNSVSVADDGSNGVDPDPSNNSDTDTDSLDGDLPDLVISKDDGGTTTTAGGTVVYTINYSNEGSIGSTGVVITETVPLHSTFNVGASSAGWTCLPDNSAGSSCTYAVGSLAGGGVGAGSVNFAVDVIDPLPAGVTQLINTTSIADDGSNGDELNPGDNTATDTTPIDAVPNLTVEKVDRQSSVIPGGVIIYDISYQNIGDQDATGVVLTETVPVHTTFDAASSSVGWTCVPDGSEGSTCTLAVGNVAAGDPSVTVQFSAQVASPLDEAKNVIFNTVSIADDGNNGQDPDLSDNQSDEQTDVEAAPDLYITKTDGGVSSGPGQTVVYQINYGNIGNQNATGVVITETVPANTVFNQSASNVTWSCTPNNSAGSTCVFAAGSVDADTSADITFAVDVVDPLPTGVNEIINTVMIEDDGTNGPDSDPDNNDDDEVTELTLNPPVGLKVGEFDVSDDRLIHWTFWWFNPNNDRDLPVFIFDVMPAGTSYVPGSATCVASGTSTCDVPTYNASLNRIELNAVLGEDEGAAIDSEPSTLNNVIVISFDTAVTTGGASQFANQANAHWDHDSDGDPTNDIVDGQPPVVTDDPVTTPVGDPTVLRTIYPVPVLSLWSMLLLIFGFMGMTWVSRRKA